MADITDADFQSEVLQSDVPVLVDFWAPWCGPCRMVGPVIEKIGKAFEGKAKVFKMNVDDNPETAGAYGISSIPTVIIVQNGEVKEKFVGVQQERVYSDALQAVL